MLVKAKKEELSHETEKALRTAPLRAASVLRFARLRRRHGGGGRQARRARCPRSRSGAHRLFCGIGGFQGLVEKAAR